MILQRRLSYLPITENSLLQKYFISPTFTFENKELIKRDINEFYSCTHVHLLDLSPIAKTCQGLFASVVMASENSMNSMETTPTPST